MTYNTIMELIDENAMWHGIKMLNLELVLLVVVWIVLIMFSTYIIKCTTHAIKDENNNNKSHLKDIIWCVLGLLLVIIGLFEITLVIYTDRKPDENYKYIVEHKSEINKIENFDYPVYKEVENMIGLSNRREYLRKYIEFKINSSVKHNNSIK